MSSPTNVLVGERFNNTHPVGSLFKVKLRDRDGKYTGKVELDRIRSTAWVTNGSTPIVETWQHGIVSLADLVAIEKAS